MVADLRLDSDKKRELLKDIKAVCVSISKETSDIEENARTSVN